MSPARISIVAVQDSNASPFIEMSGEAIVVVLDPTIITQTALSDVSQEARQILARADAVLATYSPKTLTRLSRLLEGHAAPLVVVGPNDTECEVAALVGGADRYLVEPVTVDRILALHAAHVRRLRTLTPHRDSRRPHWATADHSAVGRLSFDWPARTAFLDGVSLGLGPLHLDLLGYLAARPGPVVSKDTLLEAVWGADVVLTPNTVEVAISHVRRKLRKRGVHGAIDSVYGRGYRCNVAAFDPSSD